MATTPPARARRPDYRLYEVQNGNHIETYKLTFPQLEFIEPHAQRAFDLLVAARGARRQALPPSQCIPRGGAISGSPAQPGHCGTASRPERRAARAGKQPAGAASPGGRARAGRSASGRAGRDAAPR